MRIKFASLVATAGMALFAAQAQAESLVDGSAEDGEAKAITCTACHGPQGNSSTSLWPNIAGQNAPYIVAQLKAFKDGMNPALNEGVRKDPLMSAQAMLLSEQDMADLAVYFEGLPGASQAVADPSVVSRGEALWRGGNLDKGIAACMSCHGPSGAGNPAAMYPMLKGQHAAYTEKALNDYASGARTSDGTPSVMRDIAERLNNDDIKAIASYIQGLK